MLLCVVSAGKELCEGEETAEEDEDVEEAGYAGVWGDIDGK
jgi:hypothetical protein